VGADRLSRARALLAESDLDAIVITHPPNIRYLTGLQASMGTLVLGPARDVLIVDGRYAAAAAALSGAGSSFAITVPEGSLDDALAAELQEAGAARIGIEADHLSVGALTRIAGLVAAGASVGAALDAGRLVPTSGLIERLRLVKDIGEIQLMREAGRRLSAVARRAREFVREGLTEFEVAAAVDAALRDAGFERPAFDTIVASGPNSALPHARPTSRPLVRGDGVVLDFGGVYDGYCVDLTRTLPIGPMAAGFRRLFEAVREAHAAAIGTVRPGVLPVEVDRAARQVLQRHGLGDAFAHGTGHGLGLEVHEGPRISKVSPAATPVAAGMVFTIEPGAYVPGIGGVRIEDDVLVVDGGCELLTDVPIEL
jgi:Xaa-Pro aminopeptidase